MIILIFLFFSCVRVSYRDASEVTRDEDILFGYSYAEESEQETLQRGSLQEQAQFFWLRGISRYDVDDFVQARALGFACIQEQTGFTVEQLQKNVLRDISFAQTDTRDCTKEYASEVMPIPISTKHVACVTWMLLSWSKLQQWYQLDEVIVHADLMLLLSAWLVEQEPCIHNSWTRFAIVMGVLQTLSVETKASGEEREAYATQLLSTLWNDEHIGQYVRLWYIKFRLQQGDVSTKQKKEWLLELSRYTTSHPEHTELMQLLP